MGSEQFQEPFGVGLSRSQAREAKDELLSANGKWVADTMGIWTTEEWLFLAVVFDLFSRMVIGWFMAPFQDATPVVQALHMALAHSRSQAGLLHHSDRGSTYTSESYQALLEQEGMQVSTSHTADCYLPTNNRCVHPYVRGLQKFRVKVMLNVKRCNWITLVEYLHWKCAHEQHREALFPHLSRTICMRIQREKRWLYFYYGVFILERLFLHWISPQKRNNYNCSIIESKEEINHD